MFTPSKEERESARQAVAEHDKTCDFADRQAQGAIGGRLTHLFTPTGIGVVYEVSCECGWTHNATDYGSW